MPTASTPPFWSNPVAATRARFEVRTMPEAMVSAFLYTVAPYYIYFWFQNDLFFMNIISSCFLLLLNVLTILRIRDKRLLDSLTLPSFGIYTSLFLLWLVLFTDAART